MPITDSRVKEGSLSFADDATGTGEVTFSCQPTSVMISTEYNESGETVQVLCGDETAPDTTADRTLKITAIQDFTDPAGLMVYLRDNELEQKYFTWQANAEAEVATGIVQCRVGDWGGEVGKRITTELELPIVGPVTWT